MNKKITYCKKCGASINNISGKCTGCGKQYFRFRNLFNLRIIACILAITNIVFAGCSYFWYSGYNYQKQKSDEMSLSITDIKEENYQYSQQLAESNSKIENLQKDHDELLKDYSDILLETMWYEQNAGICTVEGKKYHTYNCFYWKDSDSFWIFNTEAAKQRGYEPCSYCH